MRAKADEGECKASKGERERADEGARARVRVDQHW
jgi:hypothetical protein